MLKLEELVALAISAHLKSLDFKFQQNKQISTPGSHVDNWFICEEQSIIASEIQWMLNAKKLYDESGREKYAGLTLAEFIAQSRPHNTPE